MAVALAAIPVIAGGAKLIVGAPLGDAQVVIREACIFASMGLLLWIVLRREGGGLASIGLHFRTPVRSLLLGLLVLVALIATAFATMALVQQLGLSAGGGGAAAPSLWVVVLVMLRAGIVEEVFYRGYAMERLMDWTGKRWVAVLVPLAAFSLAHFRGGFGGVIIAFTLGLVLVLFYLWKRDLLANIVGHILIDFIPNVLMPLLGGE